MQKRKSKILLKKPKSLQDIITLITNLKFQHNPKNIIFQKSSYKNRPIIIIIIIT
jgi:hypothetical protein